MKALRLSGYTLITFGLYAGIILLGWGLDDLRGFLVASPRAGYVLLVGVFSLAIGRQMLEAPEGVVGSRGDSEKRVSRQTLVARFLTLSAAVMMWLLPWADRHQFGVWPEDALLGWVGLFCAAMGFWLIYASGVALGRMYSAEVTIQKDHQLVTDGVYRNIRHPRYLGILLFGLGLSYLFRSWIGLVVMVLVLGVLLYRIRDEERLLQEEFGSTWHDYCKHSWKLIPYLF